MPYRDTLGVTGDRNYATKNVDKAVEKRLLTMMKENPAGLLLYFLSIAGREAVEANAETLDLKTEATFNGKRYEIKAKVSAKEIKITKPKKV